MSSGFAVVVIALCLGSCSIILTVVLLTVSDRVATLEQRVAELEDRR